MILSRYIDKTIISSILIVVVVLTAFEFFAESTREFSDIGVGYYTLGQALQYIPLMLPQDVYQLFPMAGLLGSLIGLGVLSSHSELVVMRASGVSITNIVQSVLKAALLLVVAMILVGEVIAPMAQHKVVSKKAMAMSGGQALMTVQGIWLRNHDNFIHVDTITPNGHLHSILRYQFDHQGHLAVASFASEGIYEDQNGWLFKNVTATEFHGDRVTSTTLADQHWDLSLDKRLLGLTNIDPEQKSLPQIYKYIQDRQVSGLNVDHYQFVFWQRAFQPLAILVMILLSVPFIFGFLGAQAMGVRIVVGAVFGFAFYIVNRFVGHFAMVYQMPAFFAALLPILLFALLGFWMLQKVR